MIEMAGSTGQVKDMSYKTGGELKDMTQNSVGAISSIEAWIRCFASNGGALVRTAEHSPNSPAFYLFHRARQIV